MFWKFILIDPKKLQQCINIDNNCPAIKTFVSITTFFIIFMDIGEGCQVGVILIQY